MKNNQPVTDEEIKLTDDHLLVSRTDLKGAISYVNDEFIDISGFSESELIGKNHNLVRHPDMPTTAFKDLWDTIQSGKPWTGIIKNRCKNGGYYWVKANVMPMVDDNGDVVEYQSVRTRPSEKEISDATALYAAIQSGTYRSSTKDKINSFVDALSIKAMLNGAAFLFAIVFTSIFLMLNSGIDSSIINSVLIPSIILSLVIGTWLAKRVTKPLEYAVTKLNEITQGNYFNWVESSRKDELGQLLDQVYMSQIKMGFEALQQKRQLAADKRIQTGLNAVDTSVMIADKYNKIVFVNDAAKAMFYHIEEKLLTHMEGFNGVDNLIDSDIQPLLMCDEMTETTFEEMQESCSNERQINGITLGVVVTPVFENDQRVGVAVEWNDLTESKRIALEASEKAKREQVLAAENSRIRTALDHVSSSVMLADNDNNIIYMNHQVKKMFDDNESAIQKDLPSFQSSKLLGANIDQFHKQPTMQHGLIKELSGAHFAEFILGGRTLAFTANPVSSSEGERIGTAVEWLDLTAEREIENEIENMVAGAKSGNLQSRLTIDGKDGFHKELSIGFNALMEEMERVFTDVGASLQRISDGDLTQPITDKYDGMFGDIKQDVNNTMRDLGGVITEMSTIAESVATASNEINAGNTSLSSRTEQQAANLQETAASMEEINSTVGHNAENSQQANQVATSARIKAEEGGEVVAKAVSAMSEINKASGKIAEIIGVIDEIAFQTNLLALNASVEAARAGDQGRGFAVVATEVRNLAGRSATAAKEIKDLIQDSVEKVEIGSQLVNDSGEMLDEIVTGVKQVGDIIAEIAAAGSEQSEGLSQVSKAVTTLDDTTQQNAALAEQISANSSSLAEHSVTLNSMIGRFRVFPGDKQQWEDAVS